MFTVKFHYFLISLFFCTYQCATLDRPSNDDDARYSLRTGSDSQGENQNQSQESTKISDNDFSAAKMKFNKDLTGENVQVISTRNFVRHLMESVQTMGYKGKLLIENILENLAESFVSGDLIAKIYYEQKIFLIKLGVLNSDERIKSFQDVTNAMKDLKQRLLNWLWETYYWLEKKLPTIHIKTPW